MNNLEESLQEGQFVWRKRQSFGVNVNRKLQFKIIEAYEILGRVATGLYRVKNVESGAVSILPIDQLIRTRLSLDEIRGVLGKLKT